MVFPERPTGNAWQLIGNSFNQGAGIVNDLGTQQNALQALVERRTQAALEQKRLEREQAAKDWEFKQKQETEKRANDAADFAKGKVISPTLVKDPTLAVSSKPMFSGGPSQSEVDSLTLAEDRIPGQRVIGGDSTALMGQALDRMQLSDPNIGRVPRTREEILQNQLENRQITGQDWAKETKPPSFTANRANPEIARAIRDELISTKRSGVPISRDLMREIILRNDPDGTFMGTREGGNLLSSSNTAAAIKNAEIAASRVDKSNDEFNVNTNIKLKEALDNDPYIKPFAAADRKYTQTQAVYDKYKKNGNPSFVDRTLVVNFNKMIDETSAVMGGEVDATIKEMGISDKLIGKIGKWSSGGAGFTDEERDQIMAVMGELHNRLKEKAQNAYYTARGQAKDLGADPDIVTGLYRPLFESGAGKYTQEYSSTPSQRQQPKGAQPVQKRRVWNPATGRVE
jgi:hypothetical protein